MVLVVISLLRVYLSIFHKVHTSLTTANVWRVASERPESASAMKFLARLLCTRTTDHQSNICDLCLKTYSDKVYHVLFQCECNNRVNIIQVFYDMTTYKFGISTLKLLVESNRETFIGYVLGATDNLLNCAILVEHYPDFLISCSHVLRNLSGKKWNLDSTSARTLFTAAALY